MNPSGMTSHSTKSTGQNIAEMKSFRNPVIKSNKLSLWTFGHYNVNYTPYKKVDNSVLTDFRTFNILASWYAPIRRSIISLPYWIILIFRVFICYHMIKTCTSFLPREEDNNTNQMFLKPSKG